MDSPLHLAIHRPASSAQRRARRLRPGPVHSFGICIQHDDAGLLMSFGGTTQRSGEVGREVEEDRLTPTRDTADISPGVFERQRNNQRREIYATRLSERNGGGAGTKHSNLVKGPPLCGHALSDADHGASQSAQIRSGRVGGGWREQDAVADMQTSRPRAAGRRQLGQHGGVDPFGFGVGCKQFLVTMNPVSKLASRFEISACCSLGLRRVSPSLALDE